MNNDVLTVLRKEITSAMADLKKCEGAYRGFKAFKNNQPGLVFCAAQFHKAASALRDHAQQLAIIAEDLHSNYSVLTQPDTTSDVNVDGHLSEI